MPKPRILKKRVPTSAPGEPIPTKKATPEKLEIPDRVRGKENATRNLAEEMEHMAFQDETVSMEALAIENFFMQGKSAGDRMNNTRGRKKKRIENPNDDDEEEEESEIRALADFTKCDLAGLRDYITDRDCQESEKQLDYLSDKEFKKWLLYLASGFNILFHGVGSKRELISRFEEEELQEYTYMRIDARKDGLNLKTVLNAINEKMKLNCAIKRGQTVLEWSRSIRRQVERHDQQLILIIDNIEAPDWRCDQEALCELLENRKCIKLIATTDHVYSTFIWNSLQLSSLSFVHITVNTFEVPLHELMTGDSRLLGLDARSNQSSHTMSSLDAFWKSLAVNSQKLFRLFFQLYFETKKPVKFWDLFNAAKDDFIASTDSALRTQLVEFKDHRVLKWTRGDDGNDQLSGMVESKMVTEFLESKGMPLDS